MPTQTQINATNAASFAQLLLELLAENPAVRDVYYCEPTGVWWVTMKDGEFNELEFGTFSEAWLHLSPPEGIDENDFTATSTVFQEWAEDFFPPEAERTDKLIPKTWLMDQFEDSTGLKIFTSQRFMKALKYWVHTHGFTFNPVELQNTQGRIIRRPEAGGPSKEMVYIQTPGKPISNQHVMIG